MPMPAMTKAQADLELALIQADADSMTSQDLYLWLQDSGLPPEIAGRLHELVDKTRKVYDKVIEVGKIVLLKIMEFVKENPNLSVGVAVRVCSISREWSQHVVFQVDRNTNTWRTACLGTGPLARIINVTPNAMKAM